LEDSDYKTNPLLNNRPPLVASFKLGTLCLAAVNHRKLFLAVDKRPSSRPLLEDRSLFLVVKLPRALVSGVNLPLEPPLLHKPALEFSRLRLEARLLPPNNRLPLEEVKALNTPLLANLSPLFLERVPLGVNLLLVPPSKPFLASQQP
jgi:hypothetical protein